MIEYPKKLLPKSIFTKLDFDNFINEPEFDNFYLLRTTDDKDFLDPFGKLSSKYVALQRDHIRDYSTNICNSYFTAADIFLKYNKAKSDRSEIMNDWGYCSIKKELYKDMCKYFDYVDDRGYFILSLKAFHNVIIDEKSNLRARVIHTPVNSNFWHCSIRWYLNDVDILTLSEKERRPHLTIARSRIIQLAETSVKNYPDLSNHFCASNRRGTIFRKLNRYFPIVGSAIISNTLI